MPESEAAPAAAGPHRVVIVDDEPEILEVLTTLVSSRGRGALDVRTASTGDDALRLVESWHPHVVLSDFRMPGMTGLELLTRVREAHPHVGRILMTGYQELWEEKVQLDEADPLLVVAKPWKNDELIATLFGALDAAQ